MRRPGNLFALSAVLLAGCGSGTGDPADPSRVKLLVKLVGGKPRVVGLLY